jgi:2-polyprenyl-3-methyl-5-hydroxy-6-metoxy-1,4-benzoquinol methylase
MKELFLALLLLGPPLIGAPAESDQQIWDAFVHWLQAQPPNSKPDELSAAYRAKQIRQGLSEDVAKHHMAVISGFFAARRKGTQILWDKVFAGDHPIFVETPTPLLVSAIENRKPGTAPDVGMGRGRNSVYLAAHGWNATGVDPSEEAIRIAQPRPQDTRAAPHRAEGSELII